MPAWAAAALLAAGCASGPPPAGAESERSDAALDAPPPHPADVACPAFTLVEPSEYTEVTPPLGGTVVFSADVHGDGDLDLVTSGSETVILRNEGAGKFTSAVVAGAGPVLLRAPADVDGDGSPDLVTVEWTPAGDLHELGLWLNDGHGRFTGRRLPFRHADPHNAVVADLDGDGRRDVIVDVWNDETAQEPATMEAILLAQGPDGSFTARSLVKVPSEFYFTDQIGAGDLDGDGDADLVMQFDNGLFQDGLVIAWNAGGSFTVDPTRYPLDGWQVLLVDLDQDGRPDIVDSERVLHNLGNHRFVSSSLRRGFDTSAGPVHAADLDGDGRLDLAVRDLKAIVVYQQVEPLRFEAHSWPAPATPAFWSAGPIALTVIDLQGDGRPDIVFSDTAARVQALEAPLQRGPSTRRLPTVIEATSFAVGALGADVDGDADMDIVEISYDTLTVISNLGGRLVKSAVVDHPGGKPDSKLDESEFFVDGAAADLDGDGRIDLAAATESGWVVTFLNRGNGRWEKGLELEASGRASAPGDETTSLVAGDLDHDGDVDLVVAQHDAREATLAGLLSFFWNDGRGGFSAAEPLSFPSEPPRTLAVSDLDRDGRVELLVGADRRLQAQIHVFVLDAQVAPKEPRFTIDLGDRSIMMHKLFPLDLDGDGAPEIVAGLYSKGQPVLWNDGMGRFDRRSEIQLCASSLVDALVAADIDGDGDRDLLAACALDSEVGIALADGRGGFTPAPPLYANHHPTGLVVSDFDARCGVDLAVMNGSLSGELWLFSNGPAPKGR